MKRNHILFVILSFCVVLSLLLSQKQSINKKEETDIPALPEDQTMEPSLNNTLDENKTEMPDIETEENTSDPEKKGHWETIVISEPAWDEYVLVKEGWTENILVKDAWDEEETYCSVYGQDSYSGYECNCGKVSGTLEEVMKHVNEDDSCNSWHNKTIYYGEAHCQAYQTEYIHHDAQYQKIYHDPEYRTVHHASRTYEKQIWVED